MPVARGTQKLGARHEKCNVLEVKKREQEIEVPLYQEAENTVRQLHAAAVVGAPLFLASLRFCVHYWIDRDTVQKS